MKERFASIGTAATLCMLAIFVAVHAILSFGSAAVETRFLCEVGGLLGRADAPAWVQAVGSAGAILWGVWFWRADRKQRNEDALVVAELAAGRTLALTTKLQFEAERMGDMFARMRMFGSAPYEFAKALKDLENLPKITDAQLLQLVPIGKSIAHNLVDGIVLLEQARIHLQDVAQKIELRPIPEEDRKVNAEVAAGLLLPAVRQFELAVAAMGRFLTVRTGVAPTPVLVSGYEH